MDDDDDDDFVTLVENNTVEHFVVMYAPMADGMKLLVRLNAWIEHRPQSNISITIVLNVGVKHNLKLNHLIASRIATFFSTRCLLV